jgi:hypothetical protein
MKSTINWLMEATGVAVGTGSWARADVAATRIPTIVAIAALFNQLSAQVDIFPHSIVGSDRPI